MNPRMALNQVEGAVSQMLGFALSEELVTDGPTGVTPEASYLEHKSPTIMDYPTSRYLRRHGGPGWADGSQGPGRSPLPRRSPGHRQRRL